MLWNFEVECCTQEKYKGEKEKKKDKSCCWNGGDQQKFADFASLTLFDMVELVFSVLLKICNQKNYNNEKTSIIL